MHDGATFTGMAGIAPGRLHGFSDEGWPLVELPDHPGPLEARALVALEPQDTGLAVAVALTAEWPLILGLIRPPLPVARVDGEVRVLEARRELQLRCGNASITLRADGRITIRGAQILSRADGANRVQGASVLLN